MSLRPADLPQPVVRLVPVLGELVDQRPLQGPGVVRLLEAGFPGELNMNASLETYIAEGGTVYCCRFGLALHGIREEDLIEGVIPAHPLDVQDAIIHYARKGAIINSVYNL